MTGPEAAAVAAVLAVVVLTAAATAPALLDGALRARTLPPRLGSWVVGAGTVLGALGTLGGRDGPRGSGSPGLARTLAATLSVPGGASTVLLAALALVVVTGALALGASRRRPGLARPAGAGSVAGSVAGRSGGRGRGAGTPGTGVLLLVLVLVAAVAGAPWRSAALLVLAPAVAAPVAAAAGALVLLVAAAWALRHATPEKVHRRARVLAVASTALLAVGAGTQIGQVGAALVLLASGGGAATPPGGVRLLVAAAVGAGALAALPVPRAPRPAPLREPPTVLVADSCAAAVLLGAAALALPVPVLPAVLAARAGGDAVRGARAVEWRTLAGR